MLKKAKGAIINIASLGIHRNCSRYIKGRKKPQLQFHEHGCKPSVKEVDQIYTQQSQQWQL
jgi:hypothetical protein